MRRNLSVISYAACLALAVSGCMTNAKSEKPMTRDEAVKILSAYFKSHGINSPGLNDNNLGGASIGDAQIYFEYQPENQSLECSALIYKFNDEPKPGVLDGFRAEEQAKSADTGGGALEYESENRGLYLSRTYTETVSDAQFARDMKRLMKASEVWGDEVLDRVASKVFHPEELNDSRRP